MSSKHFNCRGGWVVLGRINVRYMKRNLQFFAGRVWTWTSLLLLSALAVLPGTAAAQFWSDNFEDTGSPSVGSRTFSHGEILCSSGFFKRTNGSDITWTGFPSGTGAFTGYTNSKYVGAMDIDRGPACGGHGTVAVAQTISWSAINITGRTGLSFKGKFGANSGAIFQGLHFTTAMDYILIESRIDGGSWEKVLGIYPNDGSANGGAMAKDTGNDRIGDGTPLTNAMSELDGTITGTGNSLELRLTIFLNNSNPGAVAFDDFRLFGSAPNTAPSATGVTNTGTLREGQTLTGNYTYSDPESNAESGSTFKWYRSDNAAGLNKVAIASATGKTYVLVAGDIGKYISFEVVPRDGSLNGTAVESALRGPVQPNVLPVELSGLSARLVAGKLLVDWRTLGESNCDRFVVEASVDGRVWKEMGTVVSKAAGGNSSVALEYSFAVPVAGLSLAGFGLLGLLLLPAVRNRWMKLGMVLLVGCAVYGCAKQGLDGKDMEGLDRAGAQLYVRLAQIDKDGTVNYSEVVLAKK